MKLPDNFNITYYADKYVAKHRDHDCCIEQIVAAVKEREYLTKSDLITVSIWKSKGYSSTPALSEAI